MAEKRNMQSAQKGISQEEKTVTDTAQDNSVFGRQNSISRKRWNLLAEAIVGGRSESFCLGSEEVSVRRFKTFGLVSFENSNSEITNTNDIKETSSEKFWKFLRFPYATNLADLKILIKIPDGTVSLQDINGFNNTGNVCIWPAEEVMAHFSLKNTEKFNGKTVLELGAGMTGLAGFAVAFGCCSQKRLKAAIHYTVGKICEEMAEENSVTYSKTVIASLAEMAYGMLDIWGKDLAAFAQHAQRQQINEADARLVFRRNPVLIAHIEKLMAPDKDPILVGNNDAPVKKKVKLARQQQASTSKVATTTEVEKAPNQNLLPPESVDLVAESVAQVLEECAPQEKSLDCPIASPNLLADDSFEGLVFDNSGGDPAQPGPSTKIGHGYGNIANTSTSTATGPVNEAETRQNPLKKGQTIQILLT